MWCFTPLCFILSRSFALLASLSGKIKKLLGKLTDNWDGIVSTMFSVCSKSVSDISAGLLIARVFVFPVRKFPDKIPETKTVWGTLRS